MNSYIALVALDIKRLLTRPASLLFSLALPLLYLFVLGSGIGASAKIGQSDYQRHIFPGVICLTILFTSCSAAVGIVIDRQIGFFKGLLIAPVSRLYLSLGKITSGAIQGIIPGILLLTLGPYLGVMYSVNILTLLLIAMVIVALVFSAIGVSASLMLPSVNVFPLIVNFVLLPLFFLSGSMYALSESPQWMIRAAYFNPVAYAVDLFRHVLYGRHLFPVYLSLSVLLGLFMALLIFSTNKISNRKNLDNSESV